MGWGNKANPRRKYSKPATYSTTKMPVTNQKLISAVAVSCAKEINQNLPGNQKK